MPLSGKGERGVRDIGKSCSNTGQGCGGGGQALHIREGWILRYAQDKPFGFTQDSPFDYTQDTPFNYAQDMPFVPNPSFHSGLRLRTAQ